MKHHHHAAPFVTIVLSGGYVEVNDFVPDVCGVGSVVVHRAGEEHADRFAAETRCLNVELPHDWRISASAAADRRLPALRDAAASVALAFYRDEANMPNALTALHTVLQQESPQDSSPEWLRRVIAEFAWTDGVPLREAAVLAGLHETHFSRAFRKYAGVTANEYRARARVRFASQLLLQTTQSISRIAQSVGMSDQSHLTRLFGERLGVTPAAYRQTFAR